MQTQQVPTEKPKKDKPYHFPSSSLPHTWTSKVPLHLHINGDSLTVIKWANAQSKIADLAYAKRVSGIYNVLATMWKQCTVAPAAPMETWFGHQFRDHNTVADALATKGRNL